jgi:hypothetical protein
LLNIAQIIGDIEQKCTRIGILSKNARFSGFNMLPDSAYVIVLIKHLNLQLSFAADIARFRKLLNC